MKRVALLLVLLLILPLALAQDADGVGPPAPEDTEAPDTPTNPQADPSADPSTEEEIKEGVEGLKNLIKTKDSALDKAIPENFQPIVANLFRMEQPSISQTIIALMILIFFIILFIDILKTFGPFSENTATLAGIILAILVSLVGTIKSFTFLLLNFGGQFSFLEDWSAGALVFAVVIVIIFLVIFRKLGKSLKEHRGLEKAYEKGAKAGAHHKFIEGMQDVSKAGT